MRILLATDGSEWSDAALDELIERPWPGGSEVCVLSVANPPPVLEEPFLLGASIYGQLLEEEQQRAARDAARAVARIHERAPGLAVAARTLVGSPQVAVLEEAERFGADLILVGSHGRGAAARFLLGSVSNAVALHAPCSVEIVRRAR